MGIYSVDRTNEVKGLRSIEKVLVTGGAGFIGSHTVDALVKESYEVTVADILDPQIHGTGSNQPEFLNPEARFVKIDIRNRAALTKLLQQSDAVIHEASAVGIGQSMYQIERYVDVNTRGTAALLDAIVNDAPNVKKLVVSSSMSVYGEGNYACMRCGRRTSPPMRSAEQVREAGWEHACECGFTITPVPTDEEKPMHPVSIYAMSKRHQEEMSLLIGKTYAIATVALRYFNTYGPRQSMSNPYTGVVAIFLSRISNNKPPYIFEDGGQLRDFIHVSDVAKATVQALQTSAADYQAINIGTGKATSILGLAKLLSDVVEKNIEPEITNKYRRGDIRHCYADTAKAEKLLGFRATTSLREGLKDVYHWAAKNKWPLEDRFEQSLDELRSRKLT